MKIKSKIIVGFLKKIRMEGTVMIGECIMNFTATGLRIEADCRTKEAKVVGVLRTEAFVDYDDIGKICLNDFENIVKVFDRFSNEVVIQKSGNLLKLSGSGKKASVELVDENFIEKVASLPDFEFHDRFNVDVLALKDIYKDVGMNKDSEIIITTGNKMVAFSNTGKYKFNTEFTAPFSEKGCVVRFGKQLVDATNSLEGNLEFSIRTDAPIKIVEETDDSTVTILLAPRVSN